MTSYRRRASLGILLSLLSCGRDPADREYFAALEAADRGAEIEEQRAHIERAIALAPDRAVYYELRSGYRGWAGDLAGAEADLDRAIALLDRPYVRFMRANVICDRGEHARALADYDRAIEGQPWNAQFYRGRALARAAVGRGAEALQDAEHLVASLPQRAESWHARGVALTALGRPEAALADFERALAMRDDLAFVWSGRAEAYERLGDLERAAEDRRLAAAAAERLSGCGFCLSPYR